MPETTGVARTSLRRSGARRRRIREALEAYLFLSPAAILLFVFGILPVGYAFYISLHRWRIQKGDFIGLANYTRLLGPGPRVAMLLGGILLLIGAYYVWRAISFQSGGWRVGLRVVLVAMLVIGGLTLVLGADGMLSYAAEERSVRQYLLSVLRTVFYSAGTVPFQLVFAFLLANLLFQQIRGRSTFRMLYFLPYITPTVATAAVWRAIIFEPRQGLANTLLSFLGVAQDHLPRWILEPQGIVVLMGQWLGIRLPDWVVSSPVLSGPSLAMVAVCIYNIWVFTGYNTVIYLAGLGAIPYELYEAAEIDGAGRWQLLRHITLPLVSPTTYFLTLMGIIGTFKAVNHIYIMTQIVGLGGPQDTTTTAAIYIFKQFREGNRWGVASAAAFILLGIILLLTWVQNRVAEERVHYV
ncbi:MAG TPA: sugar ABC transporter permease [Chloroflexi bacterium]|nr:sugar ABC transporter permease [Chloroflexota bacterium]